MMRHYFLLMGLERIEGGKQLCCVFVELPGNACDLGNVESGDRIRQMGDDEMIVYSPHNVDSMWQAYMLLAIWLKWFDGAFAMVESSEH